MPRNYVTAHGLRNPNVLWLTPPGLLRRQPSPEGEGGCRHKSSTSRALLLPEQQIIIVFDA